MKIGINARYVQRKIFTGIENYIYNLLLNLKKIDKKNKYYLFFEKDRQIPIKFSDNTNFKTIIPKFPTRNQIERIALNQFSMNSYIKRARLDVFHEPFFTSPFFKNCPTIITIYDISNYIHPEFFNLKTKLYFNLLFPRSIKNSDHIITISKSSKEDIVNYLKVEPDKIEVIYAGIDNDFTKIISENKLGGVKIKYNISQDYILYVSFISPRKNLVNLIKAFNIFKKNTKEGVQLVIVGGKGWNSKKVFELVKSLKLENDIIFTDYVPKEDLIILYSYAILFIYPSIYEGFGLPTLEAMSCGCPVITSKLSSLPEVCGDAALYIDPYDVEDIAAAILNLTIDDNLKKLLIVKGFQNIKRFDWVKTATETLKIYERFN
jgi:glycosyltransferase involved in cell wall biosynthesis